jgi:hypothetical protein
VASFGHLGQIFFQISQMISICLQPVGKDPEGIM